MAGYSQAECGDFDVDRARELLAKAGYPGGKGLPKVEILYNDGEAHRTIAERVYSDWKKHLGIDVELKPLEWGVYLSTVQQMDYSAARAGWIGDYPDPNTFLDMFVTDGDNNNTGWSNARYDKLIERATTIDDPAERLKVLAEAEAILMDEVPIIPVHFYVSRNLVRPRIEGFYSNVQDLHPLHRLSVGPRAAPSPSRAND
jgi:oligopeptide transport system substrate-binding protein